MGLFPEYSLLLTTRVLLLFFFGQEKSKMKTKKSLKLVPISVNKCFIIPAVGVV